MTTKPIYTTPPDEVFQALARAACADSLPREVSTGLAAFLIFLAALLAKHLNGGQHDLLDSPPDAG